MWMRNVGGVLAWFTSGGTTDQEMGLNHPQIECSSLWWVLQLFLTVLKIRKILQRKQIWSYVFLSLKLKICDPLPSRKVSCVFWLPAFASCFTQSLCICIFWCHFKMSNWSGGSTLTVYAAPCTKIQISISNWTFHSNARPLWKICICQN